MIEINWDWVRSEIVRSERVKMTNDLGYNPKVVKLLEDSLAQAKAITKPKYHTVTASITRITEDSITINNNVELKSRKLATTLKGASEIIAFLVTIGNNVERIATVFITTDDPAAGYMLDRVGSLATESLADSLEESLRDEYDKKGKSLSMRFSPGYCDWPTTEQTALSKIINFSDAGITLNDGLMMVPRKSISGIMAVGPKGTLKGKVVPCSICAKKDCDFRRE